MMNPCINITLNIFLQSLLSSVDLKKAVEMSIDPKEDEKQEINKVGDVNATALTNEKQDEPVSLAEQSEDVADKKNRKNRGSALMEELLWSGKRRSARVRSSLKGNHEPMDVAEALRRILPRRLL